MMLVQNCTSGPCYYIYICIIGNDNSSELSENDMKMKITPAPERLLGGGGGACMFIYSGSVRLISFEINSNNNWFQKK